MSAGPWTAKQREYLNCATRRWDIKAGATRSGKTYLDYYVIPKRIKRIRGLDGLIIIIGNTKGTLQRNVIDPMQNIWGADVVSDIRSDNTATMFGEKVYCLGADNKNHIDKFRGLSAKYIYGDEVVSWNSEVFEMLKSRLDKSYSRFDGTCNPGSPDHWFKKFIDGGADIYYQEYSIYDNDFLPPDVRRNMEKEHTGVFFDRYILGKWTRAEGAIYAVFIENENDFYKAAYDEGGKRLLINGKYEKLDYINIGVDWGGNKSGHAFVATGITSGYANVAILRGEWHAAAGTTPEDVCRWLLEFTGRVQKEFGAVDAIYADSAEQLLINMLRQRTSIVVRNSIKRPIVDRIRFTTSLMAQRRLFIMPCCENVVKFFKTAVYNDKAQDDERLDDGSYEVDSGDAFEYSFERYMEYVIRE